MFQTYRGSIEELSPPERFLAGMATVPRLVTKINLLILLQQFDVSLNPLMLEPGPLKTERGVCVCVCVWGGGGGGGFATSVDANLDPSYSESPCLLPTTLVVTRLRVVAG